VFDDDRFALEYGTSPPSDSTFYRAWAEHLAALAEVLNSDGWWAQVERILAGDEFGQFVLAILFAAKEGDTNRTAVLLEQAGERGAATMAVGAWLRGGLYRMLLWIGTGPAPAPAPPPTPPPQQEDTETQALTSRVRPGINEHMAAMFLADPLERINWSATRWAAELEKSLGHPVTAGGVKQTQTWKKTIHTARIAAQIDRMPRGQ
jgi:hypothetical protein